MTSQEDHPSKARILIVDDTPEYALVLSQILEKRGYAVNVVRDGEKALQSAFAAPPDLIMMDISMPVMDGLEACRRLKAEPQTQSIPVIFLSSLQDIEDKVRAFKAGGVDYVIKPFQMEEVLARLENHLSIRKLQVELEKANQQLSERLEELSQAQAAEREQRMLAEVLRDSIAAINSTLDYDRLLDIILNNLALVVPHDAASIAILDKDGMIRVERSRGYKDLQLEEFIQSMRVPLTFFPNWKRVFQDQIVLNVPDVRSEKDWVYLPETSWIRSYLCAPIVIKNQVIGIFNLDSSQPRFFSSESAKRLQAFAHQAAIAIEKTNLFRETQRLAITDGLTGIYNNRHIMDLTERELKRAKRYQRHLCAILFDLDFFKQVNDRFGHLTGNMVLQTVTRLCSASVRESDLIGRYGGEEFLIITPETDIAEAAEIAERLRQGIEKMRIPTEKGDVHVTISLGVATCEPGSDLSLQELIRRVDEALYVSKAKGRNCVSLWEDNPTAV